MRARPKISIGKAADVNADGRGYAPSGASQYTRRVATHGTKEALATNVDREPRLVTMLRKHKLALVRYEAKLHVASGPKERERLLRHIEIKQEFLERLRLDRCGELGIVK